jgi:hypothetical protein
MDPSTLSSIESQHQNFINENQKRRANHKQILSKISDYQS